MKYMVGLNSSDHCFLDTIIENKQQIHEVYFSWGDLPNGRSSQLEHSDFTPWEMQDLQRRALKTLSDEGIALNLLFNANCYGKDSQSRSFFNKIGTITEYILNHY